MDLDLLCSMGIWRSVKELGERREREAGSLLAALVVAKDRFGTEIARREEELKLLENEKTRLESARTTNGRRQNFFRRLKAQLEVGEAEAELKGVKVPELLHKETSGWLKWGWSWENWGTVTAHVAELERALELERAQAKPVLEALQVFGAAYKFQVEQAAGVVATNQANAQRERQAFTIA